MKGGVGTTFLATEFTVDETSVEPDLGSGLGLIAGAGYDITLGEHVSFTPAVNVWFGRIGVLEVDRETFVSGWKHNVIDVTIGLTFH